MRENDWVDAGEALRRLGVRPQTLYAYVSRGRVRAEPDPVEPRRSRYRTSDIAALAQRKSRGRKAAAVAAEAIAWGEPVLASAITTVADGRLYYRGRDAVLLAETETFEGVARLLRGGGGAPAPRIWRRAPLPGPTVRGRLFATLAARTAADAPARDQSPAASWPMKPPPCWMWSPTRSAARSTAGRSTSAWAGPSAAARRASTSSVGLWC